MTVKIKFQTSLTNIPEWLNKTGLIIKVPEDQKRNEPFAFLLAQSNIPDKTLTFCLTDCRKTFENFKIYGEGDKMSIELREPLDYETKRNYQIWAKVMVRLLFSGFHFIKPFLLGTVVKGFVNQVKVNFLYIK